MRLGSKARPSWSIWLWKSPQSSLGEVVYVWNKFIHFTVNSLMIARTLSSVEFKNSIFSTNTFSFLTLKLLSNKSITYLKIAKQNKIMLLSISIKKETSQSYQYLPHWYTINNGNRAINFTHETDMQMFKKQIFLRYIKSLHANQQN